MGRKFIDCREYPSERGTWKHVWEVATGAGTTPNAIGNACARGYTGDGARPFTVEEAIGRLGVVQ